MREKIISLGEKYFDEIVQTASEMIQIPSKSGFEKEMAEYTINKMKELGYDEITVDEVGNVVGKINGTGNGKSVMFNCHLDIVDEGNHDKWKYPPYSGAIAEGAIWGRGASDTKGTFAIQVYTPAILKKENMLPKGDLYVVGVIHEESSGFGAMYMTGKGFKTDYAVVGEATENDIAISNRGRMAIEVKIHGKSCHASVPHMGVNPFNFLGNFLNSLEEFELGHDEVFGNSTMSPTNISSSEKGNNILPNTITLQLDYRSVPVDTEAFVIEKLQKIVDKCMIPGITVEIYAVRVPISCYTGHQGMGLQGEPAYKIDENHELVQYSIEALSEIYGRKVPAKPWNFATDCGHFMNSGTPVIGFSPAELKYCHTVEDQISLEMMKEGVSGNLALAYKLGNISK